MQQLQQIMEIEESEQFSMRMHANPADSTLDSISLKQQVTKKRKFPFDKQLNPKVTIAQRAVRPSQHCAVCNAKIQLHERSATL